MKNIKRVNETFLITVIIVIASSFFLGNISFIRESYLANLLVSQIIYVIPVAIYLFRSKGRFTEKLRIRKVSAVNVILLVLLSFFLAPLMTFINAISLLFSTNVITDTVTGIVTDYSYLIGLTAIAFIPAVLEECVYRGVFFNEYRKVNPLKGIVLSGFLFGLMHMNFNQFVYAFAMGMVFAIIVEAADSIIASMIVHFTMNASSVTLTWLMPKIEKLITKLQADTNSEFLAEQAMDTSISAETLLPVIAVYGVIAIFTTAVAFVLLMAICRIAGRPFVLKELFKKKQQTPANFGETGILCEQGEKGRLITLPLVLGITACLFLMIYLEIVIRLLR